MLARDDDQRIITLMEISDDQHQIVPPSAQFADAGSPVPAEVLEWSRKAMAELVEYRRGVADGSIQRQPLTRAQLLICKHSQAALEG